MMLFSVFACKKFIRRDVILGLFVGYLTSSLLSSFSTPSTKHFTLTDVRDETRMNTQNILCWVVTVPNRHYRAQNIKKTWGKRCDTLLFISSKPDETLPTVVLPLMEESRRKLWMKATMTLSYIYKNHFKDHDWFFKADDDTYALIDNLRAYLATLNSSLPLFLGHEFPYGIKPNITYLSGGAGYVLSKEAMRRLVEQGLTQDLCPYRSFTGEEDDVVITECLKKVGVSIPDTRDIYDNHRFLSCNIVQCFEHKVGDYDCESINEKRNCLSKRPFTFHYVLDTEMLAYEYLLYQANAMEVNFEEHFR